ncbi:MAG TPA: acetate--CoA ligase, partial [Candidatus Binatia bacterium]
MGFEPIKKNLNALKVTPNLDDYARTCAEFAWEKAEQAITRLPGNSGLNIAYECVDRHASSARRDRLALRWISKSGETRDISYEGLRRLTNRFANVLRSLGIGKGDRV